MKGLANKRREKGLTLRQMAEALGLAYQTYCNYEYGNREPNFDTLTKMAKFFDCAIDELI